MNRRAKATDNQVGWCGPATVASYTVEPRRYRAKVFQSGNSVALRLPADLGYAAGSEVDLQVDAEGRCTFAPADAPKRKFNIDKVWGCAADYKRDLIKSEDRVFETRPLLWDDPEWRARIGWKG